VLHIGHRYEYIRRRFSQDANKIERLDIPFYIAHKLSIASGKT